MYIERSERGAKVPRGSFATHASYSFGLLVSQSQAYYNQQTNVEFLGPIR